MDIKQILLYHSRFPCVGEKSFNFYRNFLIFELMLESLGTIIVRLLSVGFKVGSCGRVSSQVVEWQNQWSILPGGAGIHTRVDHKGATIASAPSALVFSAHTIKLEGGKMYLRPVLQLQAKAPTW